MKLGDMALRDFFTDCPFSVNSKGQFPDCDCKFLEICQVSEENGGVSFYDEVLDEEIE